KQRSLVNVRESKGPQPPHVVESAHRSRWPLFLGDWCMRERSRARVIAYGIAVAAPAVSLLLRWPLWPVLGDAVPHMTFLPAVMIAAYFGGFRPGLLATGLSALAANLIPKQLPTFQATRVNEVAALMLFLLVGSIISG